MMNDVSARALGVTSFYLRRGRAGQPIVHRLRQNLLTKMSDWEFDNCGRYREVHKKSGLLAGVVDNWLCGGENCYIQSVYWYMLIQHYYDHFHASVLNKMIQLLFINSFHLESNLIATGL